jgi:hypothetical protein
LVGGWVLVHAYTLIVTQDTQWICALKSKDSLCEVSRDGVLPG